MRQKAIYGAAAMAGTAVMFGGAVALGSQSTNYLGHGEGDRQMTIRVSVDQDSQPPRVRLRAGGVRLYCDDGTRFRMALPVRSTRLYDRTMSVEYDRVNPQTGSEIYYYARGTFNRAVSRVRGFLTVAYDFGAGIDAPSCSTAGRATWRASR